MSAYSTLLVATDLSEPATSALRHAASLADLAGGSLTVCFVVEDRLPPMILAQTSDVEGLLERHRSTAEKHLREYVERHLPGRPVELAIRLGAVHDQIVQLARAKQADLIVVGMHGHGFLAHALAGSTAERVLHHAPCPVLVVPHDS